MITQGTKLDKIYGQSRRLNARLMVAKIKMIRWMCGYTRLDRIINEVIRDKERVARIKRSDDEDQTKMVWSC